MLYYIMLHYIISTLDSRTSGPTHAAISSFVGRADNRFNINLPFER